MVEQETSTSSSEVSESTAKHAQLVERKGYFSVSVTTLRPGELMDFCVFAPNNGQLSLANSPGSKFSLEQRSHILQSGQAHIFIANHECDLYYKYLEDNILGLLADDGKNITERTGRFASVGEAVTRQLLSEPDTARSRAMAYQWVEATGDYLESTEGVLAAFVSVLEVAPDLYAHSMHTCMYGLALAKDQQLATSEELGDLGMGLLLHDIGMLDLPLELRQKTGPLEKDELQLIQSHPLLGAEKVQSLTWVGPIARDVIRYHHERPDGQGYPGEKAGRRLSCFAKVAAIANTFDSRTTQRPYRDAQPSMQVLKEMIRSGSSQFDSRLLAAFVRLLSQ